jgi:hypothetical protein
MREKAFLVPGVTERLTAMSVGCRCCVRYMREQGATLICGSLVEELFGSDGARQCNVRINVLQEDKELVLVRVRGASSFD